MFDAIKMLGRMATLAKAAMVEETPNWNEDDMAPRQTKEERDEANRLQRRGDLTAALKKHGFAFSITDLEGDNAALAEVLGGLVSIIGHLRADNERTGAERDEAKQTAHDAKERNKGAIEALSALGGGHPGPFAGFPRY